MFLGEDLLAWLVLAIGGALVAGHGLALIRPPVETREGHLERAPRGRSMVMMAVGLVATVWALGSLLSG